MIVIRSTDLAEALLGILSRSTETRQTGCLNALHSLLYRHGRHYLFQTNRTGFLLIPEEEAYCTWTEEHSQWLTAAEGNAHHVQCYALTIHKRAYGRVTGDLYVLDPEYHLVDLEMNTAETPQKRPSIRAHLRDLHHCREQNARTASLSSHLRRLEHEYMAQSRIYRAGFRRICAEDAALLLLQDNLPVYRLDQPDYARPLRRISAESQQDQAVYGIHSRDSAEYDRWLRERLEIARRLRA